MTRRNIAVCGVKGAGKSTWLKRMGTGEFSGDRIGERCWCPYGSDLFTETDMDDLGKFDGIVIFDNNDFELYSGDIIQKNLPTVVVLSFCDIKDRYPEKVMRELSMKWGAVKRNEDRLCIISSRSNYDLERPCMFFEKLRV